MDFFLSFSNSEMEEWIKIFKATAVDVMQGESASMFTQNSR